MNYWTKHSLSHFIFQTIWTITQITFSLNAELTAVHSLLNEVISGIYRAPLTPLKNGYGRSGKAILAQHLGSGELYFLKLTERWWINFAILLKRQIPEVNLEEPGRHPSWTAGRQREKFRWCLADQYQDKFPQLPQEEPREMNYPVKVCVRVKKRKIKMLFSKVWLDMEEAPHILTGFLNDSSRW